ncbi:DUF2637 domain-containing protein [Streptomyces sp. NPDC057426]|uniref:DUF2637 domain-containing protein n=1 Tax=Streptomyces sp. NPDC057426 TaxID=3346128 RepID=UPI00368ECCE0
MADGNSPILLSRTHRILIGVVIAGALIIAGIGFAGSYAAVRELALEKGFGDFSYFFPIGIDAGICVLLALDLLLTWIRIPFPLLRQTAWVLTAATIAFNGAAAWPDPLGVGMHAVIPVLFVVAVEAARHAVGRIADITADKHMEGVRITRWLLSPIPTFRLWRRMKLWELRSYEQVIKLEQDRLIYQAQLQARFGRAWRRKAPVEALMPLRLAKYGLPLAETAAAGLAAAGIEPVLIPSQPDASQPVVQAAAPPASQVPQLLRGPDRQPAPASRAADERSETVVATVSNPWFAPHDLPSPDENSELAPAFPSPHEESRSAEAAAEYEAGNGDLVPKAGTEMSQLWLVDPDLLQDETLAEPAGAYADRTGGSRIVVQARIPEQDDTGPEPSDPPVPADASPGGDGTEAGGDEGEPAEKGERSEPEPPVGLKGIELVEWHYWRLPELLRTKSANALAPRLAEATGYKEGTVRKYIGDIKRKGASAAAGG